MQDIAVFHMLDSRERRPGLKGGLHLGELPFGTVSLDFHRPVGQVSGPTRNPYLPCGPKNEPTEPNPLDAS